jgi:hypothetical protein
MRRVFIVDRYKHPALLRFTQTKVMFDANNVYTNWCDDIVTVDSVDAVDQPGIVIASGEFVTTDFRSRTWDWNQHHVAIGDMDLIQFDPEYSYLIHERPPFAHGSKQLYIVENLYRTVLQSQRLLYVDNTESYTPRSYHDRVLYGLASGWKTLRMARDSEFDRVIVYDRNVRQLEYQKDLHSRYFIPDQLATGKATVGSITVPEDVKAYWKTWHNTQVEFRLLDLFDSVKLEDHSVIWVSNVFCYEPSIFEHGWEFCQAAQHRLQIANPTCTIVEN